MQIQKLLGKYYQDRRTEFKNLIYGVDAVTHNAVSKGFVFANIVTVLIDTKTNWTGFFISRSKLKKNQTVLDIYL